MTITDIYNLYLQGIGVEKRLVFCNIETNAGFEIKTTKQFENVMQVLNGKDLFILNQQEADNLTYFEYFVMAKKAEPVIAIVRHPNLTNAYWKENPDHIIDNLIIEGNIYRYIDVDYGNTMRENIIELPSKVDDAIWALLKRKFKGAFLKNIDVADASYSLVFSNTNRFDYVTEQIGVKIYPLSVASGTLKQITIKSVSNKVWKEIKTIGKKQNEKTEVITI